MRADVRKSPGTDMDPASRILRRVRIQDVQLPAAKVSNPKFRGKVWKFPRYFKGHLPIGNVQVRILPGQPASPPPRDFALSNARNARHGGFCKLARCLQAPYFGALAAKMPKVSGRMPDYSRGDRDRRLGSICTAWPSLERKSPIFRNGRRQIGNAARRLLAGRLP
jgi:hypothetical protein